VKNIFHRFQTVFDRFLFESCDPTIASVLRIGFAILLLINTSVWMLDGERWFSDAGVLKAETVPGLSEIPYWSVFLLSSSNVFVQFGLLALMLHSLLLLVGRWSRFQAACIFFWLVSFQHRNPLICDGEDTVFRLFAFFFIFLPLDHAWSISNGFRKTAILAADRSSAWGLRLIQFQMTAIYLSAAYSKLQGTTWRDGSAMFYVFLMDDYMGRNGISEWALDSPWVIRCLTWAAIMIELALPFALWCKYTRRFAVLLGIGFHLSLELSMNLFLFEWLMILGLLSFLAIVREPTSSSTD
jgi:Vitamin K-dependent gamma-carboxylase